MLGIGLRPRKGNRPLHALLSWPRFADRGLRKSGGVPRKMRRSAGYAAPGVVRTTLRPADIALHAALSNQEPRVIAAGVILQLMSVQTLQSGRHEGWPRLRKFMKVLR